MEMINGVCVHRFFRSPRAANAKVLVTEPLVKGAFQAASGLSRDECQKLIRKFGPRCRPTEAVLPGKSLSRRCKAVSIERYAETERVYKKLSEVALLFAEAAEAKVAHFEAPVLCRYDEQDHFTWHSDLGNAAPMNRRKGALIVQLSDPRDYAGSSVLLREGPHTVSASDACGMGVWISATVEHSVTPVFHGTRYSLVLMCLT